jgi:hypothetical protein
MKAEVDLIAADVAAHLQSLGAAIDTDKIVNPIVSVILHGRYHPRSLTMFTQRTREASPAIIDGSVLDRMARSLETLAREIPADEDISKPLRAEYQRLVDEVCAERVQFTDLLMQSSAVKSPDLAPGYLSFATNPHLIVALDQVRREHIALALRQPIVEILSQWLDGRVAATIEECFLGFSNIVHHETGMRSLWNDDPAPNDERYAVAYIAREQMLNACFVEKDSPDYARQRYLQNINSAILLMFEWDVTAPWKLFKEGRNALDFDRIEAVSNAARLAWELEGLHA